MNVPGTCAAELLEYARSAFLRDRVVHEFINPELGSWCITVGGKGESRWLDVVWGPLSGFGGTDVKNHPSDDPDIFAPFAVRFESIDDAKRWLCRHSTVE